MSRFLAVLATIALTATVEVVVLVAVGAQIGALPTIALMIATSALGAALLRHQGSRAWQTFRSDVEAGRPPGPAATDGVLVLFGSVLMMVPGFVSDVAGVLMLLPPTRRVLRSLALRAIVARLGSATAMTLFGPRRVRVWSPERPETARTAYRPGRPSRDGSEPIEGEIIDPH